MNDEYWAERKLCTKCGIEKPLTDYYKSGKYYQPYCKSCANKQRIIADRALQAKRKKEREDVDQQNRQNERNEQNQQDEQKAVVECPPHHWLYGDAAILKNFPNFYSYHSAPKADEDYRVCLKCDLAELMPSEGTKKRPTTAEERRIADLAASLVEEARAKQRAELVAAAAAASQNGHHVPVVPILTTLREAMPSRMSGLMAGSAVSQTQEVARQGPSTGKLPEIPQISIPTLEEILDEPEPEPVEVLLEAGFEGGTEDSGDVNDSRIGMSLMPPPDLAEAAVPVPVSPAVSDGADGADGADGGGLNLADAGRLGVFGLAEKLARAEKALAESDTVRQAQAFELAELRAKLEVIEAKERIRDLDRQMAWHNRVWNELMEERDALKQKYGLK